MNNPVLIQVLQTASIPGAENYRLATGYTLLEGTLPVRENDVWMVTVADERTMTSHVVALDSIIRPIHPESFPVSRYCSPIPAPEAASCSLPEESAEHDHSLDACFNPTTPEDQREIARQAASTDHDQKAQAQETYASVGEKLKRKLREAAEELNPEAAARAQQTYSEASPPRVATGTAGSGGSGGSAPRSGAPITLGEAGGATVLAANAEGAPHVPTTTAGFLGFESGGSVPTVMSSAVHDFRSTSYRETADGDDSVLPTVRMASVPAALSSAPFTFTVPAYVTDATTGALGAPPMKDAQSEMAYFNVFVRPHLVRDPSSEPLIRLVEAMPEIAYGVRHALAGAHQGWRLDYGAPSPTDRGAVLSLHIRLDLGRGRIEISRDTTASLLHFSDPDLGDSAEGKEEGRHRWSDYEGRPIGGNLTLFPIGSDADFAGPLNVFYILIPLQYLQGTRFGEGSRAPQTDGGVTDRVIAKAERQDPAHKDQADGAGVKAAIRTAGGEIAIAASRIKRRRTKKNSIPPPPD